MITTAKEYFDYLAEIESSNPPSLALLPTQEKIYNIELDSRLVEAPEYLSVEKDHKAEMEPKARTVRKRLDIQRRNTAMGAA